MSAGLPKLADEVSDIIRDNREVLDTLDESYVESRCGPASSFTREIAERCARTSEQLLDRLGKIRKGGKGS